MKKYSQVINIGWSYWQHHRFSSSNKVITIKHNYPWRRVILQKPAPKNYILADIASVYFSAFL